MTQWRVLQCATTAGFRQELTRGRLKSPLSTVRNVHRRYWLSGKLVLRNLEFSLCKTIDVPKHTIVSFRTIGGRQEFNRAVHGCDSDYRTARIHGASKLLC